MTPWGLAALPHGVLSVRTEDHAGLLASWLAARLHPLDTPPHHTADFITLDLSLRGEDVLHEWAGLPPPPARPGRVGVQHHAKQQTTVVNYGGKMTVALSPGRGLICLSPLQGFSPDEKKLLMAHRLLSQGLGDFLALLKPAALGWWHGAAVVADHAAHVLLGPSGAGKSTTALLLQSAGCPVLADDMTPIDLMQHTVCPSPEPVVTARAPAPLAAFWVLRKGDALAAERLHGATVFQTLRTHRWGEAVLPGAVQLDTLAALSPVPVYQLTLPPLEQLDAQALAALLRVCL